MYLITNTDHTIIIYAWKFLVVSLINDDFNRMNALHQIKKVAKLSSVCNYAKSLCTLLTELCFEPRHRDLCYIDN